MRLTDYLLDQYKTNFKKFKNLQNPFDSSILFYFALTINHSQWLFLSHHKMFMTYQCIYGYLYGRLNYP